MSKTFYFSHDGNARNDEKIISIRLKYGAEGYGVYFMILERLMESNEYIHVKDYNVIAFDLRVSNSLVKSIIEDFRLFEFTEDGKHFYSLSFKNRMKPLDNLRKQRIEAGKKSAENRIKNSAENQELGTTVERPLPKNSTNKSKVKESIEEFNLVVEEKKGETSEIEKSIIPETEEKEKSSSENDFNFYDEKENFILSQSQKLELVAMQNKISISVVKEKVKEFIIHCKLESINWVNDDEAFKHFKNWIPKNLERKQSVSKVNGKQILTMF